MSAGNLGPVKKGTGLDPPNYMSDRGGSSNTRQGHEMLLKNFAFWKRCSTRFGCNDIYHAAGVSKEGNIGGFMYQKHKLRWKILVEIKKAIYTKIYRGLRHRAARAP